MRCFEGGGVEARIEPTSLAHITYTSGTTGPPRGVTFTHEDVTFGYREMKALGGPMWAGAEARRLLHAAPISTSLAQRFLLEPLFLEGTTTIALPEFSPRRFLDALQEHEPDRIHLVPAMAHSLVATRERRVQETSFVRFVVLSSAHTRLPDLMGLRDLFPRATVIVTYGLTECAAWTEMPFDPDRPETAGRPQLASQVRIVDDTGKEVPPGVVGEILLGYPGRPMRSYFRDLVASADVFRDGWTHTGDLGYRDEEDYLYVLDRKKDLIFSGGMKVSSLEVENVLNGHPAVQDVAVFGIPHGPMDDEVAAAVVVRSEVSVNDLRSYLKDRLTTYKIPRRIWRMDSLPRNALGKVLKRDLRDLALQRTRVSFQPPETKVETAICSIFERVFGTGPIGVHHDFFALGGDSLVASEILAALEDEFDVRLAMPVVFERPTPAELAEAVEAATRGEGRR